MLPEPVWKYRRALLLALVVLGSVFAAKNFLTPAGLESLLGAVRRLGVWGEISMVAIYILACVLALPASVLTLAAGFLFGLWKGYLVVAAGSVLGASAAFWIGRTIGRGWVSRQVEGRARFSALDRAVEKNGFRMVVLTRLSPVFPFNLQNFAYGVTGVRFRDYFWASLIGMFPGTVLFVYLGGAMKSLAEVLSGKVPPVAGRQAMFVAGLAATIIVTVLATRLASRALKESEGNPSA